MEQSRRDFLATLQAFLGFSDNNDLKKLLTPLIAGKDNTARIKKLIKFYTREVTLEGKAQHPLDVYSYNLSQILKDFLIVPVGPFPQGYSNPAGDVAQMEKRLSALNLETANAIRYYFYSLKDVNSPAMQAALQDFSAASDAAIRAQIKNVCDYMIAGLDAGTIINLDYTVEQLRNAALKGRISADDPACGYIDLKYLWDELHRESDLTCDLGDNYWVRRHYEILAQEVREIFVIAKRHEVSPIALFRASRMLNGDINIGQGYAARQSPFTGNEKQYRDYFRPAEHSSDTIQQLLDATNVPDGVQFIEPDNDLFKRARKAGCSEEWIEAARKAAEKSFGQLIELIDRQTPNKGHEQKELSHVEKVLKDREIRYHPKSDDPGAVGAPIRRGDWARNDYY